MNHNKQTPGHPPCVCMQSGNTLQITVRATTDGEVKQRKRKGAPQVPLYSVTLQLFNYRTVTRTCSPTEGVSQPGQELQHPSFQPSERHGAAGTGWQPSEPFSAFCRCYSQCISITSQPVLQNTGHSPAKIALKLHLPNVRLTLRTAVFHGPPAQEQRTNGSGALFSQTSTHRNPAVPTIGICEPHRDDGSHAVRALTPSSRRTTRGSQGHRGRPARRPLSRSPRCGRRLRAKRQHRGRAHGGRLRARHAGRTGPCRTAASSRARRLRRPPVPASRSGTSSAPGSCAEAAEVEGTSPSKRAEAATAPCSILCAAGAGRAAPPPPNTGRPRPAQPSRGFGETRRADLAGRVGSRSGRSDFLAAGGAP